jgi:hypoxanthine phosphoribosyltransferase
MDIKPHPIPRQWRKEIESVLITGEQLALRIAQLSRKIQRDYKSKNLVMVSVLNGTVFFLPDLIRRITLPLRLDFIGVSSYGSGTRSGKIIFTKELKIDVRGRDVLIVDDILDTGKTMKGVVGALSKLGPRQIKTCVLLDKPERRIEKIEADYVGFTIPNLFVVGYGLDYAENYRNLPFIGVLKAPVAN